MRFVALLAVLAVAGEARAGSIKLVSGGPDRVQDKRDVVQRLIRAGRKLSACMRGRKQPVRIKASVRRSGRVRWVRVGKRSRAAACAARVIRRRRFGRQAKGWTMVVELSTGAPVSGVRRDMTRLRRQLSGLRDAINRCARRYGASGTARASFVVAATGRLTRSAINASRGVSSRARTCMVRAIRAVDVGAMPGALAVPFRLSFGFAHGGHSANRPIHTRVGKRLQPKKFGPLAATAIAAVMAKKARRFRRCYRRYRKPGLSGDVVMRFTVRKNGTVRNVKIRKSTLKHKRIERCIVAVGKTLRFPTSYGTTRVFYPFSF